MTDEQLHAIMPGLSAPKRVQLLPFLQAAMAEFEIAKPAREAAFVAQLAHESGQLRFMEEIWGPTDAQRRYEPPSALAAKLGNTESGDGQRFKGRGPIQITGRSNYRRFGDLLGIDLVSDPGRAALPGVAFRVAGLFWIKQGLNELADSASADAFREITRRINGGLNGLADRARFYAVARAVLGVTDAPVTRDAERGDTIPGAPGEPEFERGHEAIRVFARRRRARKDTSAPRKIRTHRPSTTRRAGRAKTKTKTSAEGRGPHRPASKRQEPGHAKRRSRKR